MKRLLDIPSLDPLREVLLLGQARLPISSSPSTTPNQSARLLPQSGPAHRSDEGIVASAAAGAATPISPISSHTNPILTARAADSIDAQDRRLAVFDTELFKTHTMRTSWGNPESRQYLIAIYQDGRSAQPGQTQADHWVRDAAAQGHTGAQWFLGFMLANGVGIPQNDTEAFKWSQLAARQGHAGAQSILGVLYLMGRGVAQSNEEAFKWCQLAAGQGHVTAQVNLGALYLTGQGVTQSNEEAFKWFQNGARQGHIGGQSNLGLLYFSGRGVAQSNEEAFKWYQKAARQGHARAGLNLAKLYEDGKGVEKNNKLALYWLLKSGLSSDGKTIVSKGAVSVEVIQFLPELFAKTPEWQSVSTLKLADLNLHDQTVTLLAQLLAEHQTLEVLDLRRSARDDKEAAALALRPSTIDERGAAALARALRDNVTLKELHLDGKAGSEPDWAEIAASLESNQNIAALTEVAEEKPFQEASMDRIPADVIRLVERATIVADQKAVEASRTYKETQELVNEMRLAFAHQFLNDPH